MRSTASGRRASLTRKFGPAMPSASSGLSGLPRRKVSDRRIVRHAMQCRREDFDCCRAEWGNESTVNQRPDDGRVAIFVAPSTDLPDNAIFWCALFVRGTLVPAGAERHANATVRCIATLYTVPDRTPSGGHRCHCGGQPAGCWRVSSLNPTIKLRQRCRG